MLQSKCPGIRKNCWIIEEMEQVQEGYFKASISYRKDSRYFYPYGYFEPITSQSSNKAILSEDQIRMALKKKTEGSLVLISRCNTPSNRGSIIHDVHYELRCTNLKLVLSKNVHQFVLSLILERFRILGRFTNITVGGACANVWRNRYKLKTSFKTISSEEAVEELIASHRFYLAFENGICKDYVTEKYFLRLSQLLVPVVLKRKILEDAGLPPSSFIAVDDFENLKQLGNYLNLLVGDNNAYLRYFGWTKKFAKPIMWRSNVFCKICEDISENVKLPSENIRKFYSKQECSYS